MFGKGESEEAEEIGYSEITNVRLRLRQRQILKVILRTVIIRQRQA